MMKIPFEILLLTSSVGGLQSAFFGVHFLTTKKGSLQANKLLAFMLLAFAIRIAKSVSYYFAEGHQLAPAFENLGYAAHLAIAPLLWLYLNAFLNKDFRLKLMPHGIHLLPSFSVLLLSPFLTADFWLHNSGYNIALYLMGGYLPFCFYLLYTRYNEIDKLQRTWSICLTAGVTIVWLAYATNYIIGIISYITAPVLFSFLMYYMSYVGLKYNRLFTNTEKYKKSTYTKEDIEQCFELLIQKMENGKVFKDAGVTLPKLAKSISVSPNLLSQVINEKTGLGFPDYINSYRIKEAQFILESPDAMRQKIASIAYDAGFNTLSAFNTAFRKFAQVTPSEYRKKFSS